MSAGLQDKDVHQETPVATYSDFIALIVGIALLGFAVYLLYGAVTNAAGGRTSIVMPLVYAGAVFVIASLVPRPISFAMFEPIRIADRFVAHPRHSPSYGCGSLRALGARNRFSACTQTYGSRY